MRSSLQASVEVMEFYAIGAYSNSGLNSVQLNIKLLCKQEWGKVYSPNQIQQPKLSEKI